MTEPTPNRSRKITLEELLRLKRHERPGPEHWARFDRELNEKVWRTLTNPPEASVGRTLPVWLARGLRWMTAGVVSTLALVFAWSTHSPLPVAVAIAPLSDHTVVSPITQVDAVSSAHAPILVASVTPAPADVVTPERATFAVANLTPSTSPAGFNKVPATVSFSANQLTGERNADALNTAAYTTRWHGSAY